MNLMIQKLKNLILKIYLKKRLEDLMNFMILKLIKLKFFLLIEMLIYYFMKRKMILIVKNMIKLILLMKKKKMKILKLIIK